MRNEKARGKKERENLFSLVTVKERGGGERAREKREGDEKGEERGENGRKDGEAGDFKSCCCLNWID